MRSLNTVKYDVYQLTKAPQEPDPRLLAALLLELCEHLEAVAAQAKAAEDASR